MPDVNNRNRNKLIFENRAHNAEGLNFHSAKPKAGALHYVRDALENLLGNGD